MIDLSTRVLERERRAGEREGLQHATFSTERRND